MYDPGDGDGMAVGNGMAVPDVTVTGTLCSASAVSANVGWDGAVTLVAAETREEGTTLGAADAGD